MATKTWNGSNSDRYDNSGGAWSPTGVPGTVDDVIISSGDSFPETGDPGITLDTGDGGGTPGQKGGT